MKKIIIFLAAISLSGSVLAQGKYFTRTGKVTFIASTPLEKIEPVNDKGNSVLDASTGRVEFAVLMKAFVFEKALMEEHFQEKYVESDKYPKSVFKGTIDNLKDIDFARDGDYKVLASGQLTLHGVTRPIKMTGMLTVSKGALMVSTEFKIAVADFNIVIPSLVREKIAKEVTVKTDASYYVMNN
jgi:hypothetical protein